MYAIAFSTDFKTVLSVMYVYLLRGRIFTVKMIKNTERALTSAWISILCTFVVIKIHFRKCGKLVELGEMNETF